MVIHIPMVKKLLSPRWMTSLLTHLLDFDPHEGSHIVHSDFDWLKGLEHSIRQELFHIGETKGYSKKRYNGSP